MTHEEETIALLRSIERSLAWIAEAMTKLANPPMVVVAGDPSNVVAQQMMQNKVVMPAGPFWGHDGKIHRRDSPISHSWNGEFPLAQRQGTPVSEDNAEPMNLQSAPGLSK